jgi:PBP1b-binding outer membrane lipoprotein LpoB
MTMKIYTISAIAAVMLLATACSEEPATPTDAETAAPATGEAALTADDDTLEPAAPKVEEGEEHDESTPHTH